MRLIITCWKFRPCPRVVAATLILVVASVSIIFYSSTVGASRPFPTSTDHTSSRLGPPAARVRATQSDVDDESRPEELLKMYRLFSRREGGAGRDFKSQPFTAASPPGDWDGPVGLWDEYKRRVPSCPDRLHN